MANTCQQPLLVIFNSIKSWNVYAEDVYAVFSTSFSKLLIYQTYSVAKSVIDAVAPAVIFVVSLRSIAEEQIKNSEFDLKVSTDNKSSRDPEISFNRVPRSVETPGTFTEDLTTDRRRQWISAVSRERPTSFLLHFTFRKGSFRYQSYIIVGVIFIESHAVTNTHSIPTFKHPPEQKKFFSLYCTLPKLYFETKIISAGNMLSKTGIFKDFNSTRSSLMMQGRELKA